MTKTVIINNYELNSSGQVRNIKTGRVLKPWIDRQGYKVIRYGAGDKNRYIHREVAKYFVNNPDEELFYEVNHIDGNKLNNDSSNLEWVNRSMNIQHSYDIGLSDRRIGREGRQGIQSNFSKLTEENVLEIRKLYSTGSYTYKKLSELFNIHFATIGYIIQRKTWKHI